MSAASPRTAGEAKRTGSPVETGRLAERFAPALEVGDVLALSGPLGAGKTCFVAGLARGIESKTRVRSPSFTLINEYRGRLLLVHLDLYRIELSGVDGLGLEEQLGRGALVVEWGEKLPASLLSDALALEFEILSEHERAIAAQASGERGRALLEAWRALEPGAGAGARS